PRTVPLGPELVARMLRLRLALGRPADGERVFPARPNRSWPRIRAAAGLADPQPRFHDLRHTAATFWLAAGLRAHAVAELLGHADAGSSIASTATRSPPRSPRPGRSWRLSSPRVD